MAFTYFFRDRETLEMIGKLILPKLYGRRYINVWDAGCADGSEAYSLAIYLRENIGEFGFRNLRICATDIDESGEFESTINRGVYPIAAVRRVNQRLYEKYFTPISEELCKVNDEIKDRVEFQRHDLLTCQPVRTGFSLVMCKNVLLHFKLKERIKVIKMFHSSLTDPGYFVTEQTQKLPQEISHLFTPITTKGQLFKKV